MAKDMKAALAKSVETEKESFQDRFSKAESVLGTGKPAPSAEEKGRVAKPKPAAPKRPKTIRDTFTLPEDDYALIAQVKRSCMKAGVEANKSEIVRAGLKVLAAMTQADLKNALGAIERLTPGRPRSDD
ncbi:hypothetical protein [Thiocystis violacea]|uniref:hypothetical protein n=1 Tax=Thiocystis violacea TaxID=13725 RepID=UPI0019069830|nr:hypothetical protein [Thiocystis violacea]MBK1724142.1 hypothetical protein [Thiocystis violacea]